MLNFFSERIAPFIGALFVAAALGVAAMGRHLVSSTDGKEILHSTTLILIVHGLYLSLSRSLLAQTTNLAASFLKVSHLMIVIGTITFAGTTLMKALGIDSGLSHLTPFSGSLLIISWLMIACSHISLRKE